MATATRRSPRRHPFPPVVVFSPILPAAIRVGEDEPPPSWDPVPSPRAMVAKGSPKMNMVGRASPKLSMRMAMASYSKKKNSPKGSGAKNSPKVKARAYWNATLEKSLVDILHEHNNNYNRGDNGWNSEGWNKMVKEFHNRNQYASFTKLQIQEKERELKRDYKILKEARKQSGCHWNENRCMIEGPPSLWDNLIVTFPKIKKFRNSKVSFPLFDALGELYDGKLAEGTYNFTSIEIPEETLVKENDYHYDIVDLTEARTCDGEYEELEVHKLQDNEDASVRRVDSFDGEGEGSGHKRGPAAVPSKKEERETKKSKKSVKIEDMMERYLEMRTKQAEDEAAQQARENEVAQGTDFSIKRCISVLNSMDVTKEEKAKAYVVFKNQEDREIFLCAFEEDQESALMWLRNEMA